MALQERESPGYGNRNVRNLENRTYREKLRELGIKRQKEKNNNKPKVCKRLFEREYNIFIVMWMGQEERFRLYIKKAFSKNRDLFRVDCVLLGLKSP